MKRTKTYVVMAILLGVGAFRYRDLLLATRQEARMGPSPRVRP